ncbi:MAG TPA: hypothetical protein VKV21_08170 [Solirubrobacteraceae bacterium]|nr:hypothetical protein [Solirubrobacteraceae bacterium]
MADLMVVRWYATVLRHTVFAEKVAEIAPVSLHYGATQYRVHVDNDDRYKINQLTWVPNHESWYAYWEGPEMIEFRARFLGKYQVPITYSWATEIAVGGRDAEVRREYAEVGPELETAPSMSDTDAF